MRSDPETVPLSGWGRFPRTRCRVLTPRTSQDVAAAIAAHDSLIAHGNGRSYGDAALNDATTARMLLTAGIHGFDPVSGRLTCAAGTLLDDLLLHFVPLGWFPPVTPGTRFVTVGGMIAADVHGKNHHAVGTFGAHVESLDLMVADGTVRHCSAGENRDLFRATIGGMGLTGVILAATFIMRPVETGIIRHEVSRARSLAEVMDRFEAAADWPYSVAWIDCLASGRTMGRAVLDLGAHATRDEARARGLSLDVPRKRTSRVPFDFPSFLLNRLSVRAFNALYYAKTREGPGFVDYRPYFYPLDALLEWNRVYGAAGFFQYQSVLPLAASKPGLTAMLRAVGAAGTGSFLSVLKRFGPVRTDSPGLMSFPMEGYTLTLDFPVNAANLKLANTLDSIVADHGGRLYLAKDARMGPDMLRFYPGLDQFRAIRAAVDPTGKFASLQSRRLGL